MCAIQLEQLRKDQPRRSRAKQQHLDPDRRIQLVEPVNCASRRLKERRFLIGQVVNFVELVLWTARTKRTS